MEHAEKEVLEKEVPHESHLLFKLLEVTAHEHVHYFFAFILRHQYPNRHCKLNGSGWNEGHVGQNPEKL